MYLTWVYCSECCKVFYHPTSSSKNRMRFGLFFFLLLAILPVLCSANDDVSTTTAAPPSAAPRSTNDNIIATSTAPPVATATNDNTTDEIQSLSSGMDFADEPSDFEIWSAIATSLARFREMTKRRLFSNRTLTSFLPHKPRSKRAHAKADGRARRRLMVGGRSLPTGERRGSLTCYDGLGCFRDDAHFNYLNAVPSDPKEIDTRFYLFTKKNPTKAEVLGGEQGRSLHASRSNAFNASNPVKVIIHGFGSSGKRSWINSMVEALLSVGDVNVIVVDWEKGATLPNYVQAAANTRLVGKQVARMIHSMRQQYGVEPKDFHLVGFSLGAHVAGYAGSEIKNISRITGLDPAAPLFEGYEETVRLDPSDAQLVDVIHSNGDSFLKGGLGAYEPLGHIDYYPNGGKVQIGCNNVFIGAITDIFFGNWHSLCHHRRAYKFFIESVSPRCPFPAFTCENFDAFRRGDCFPCENPVDCSYMGYYADRTKGRGKMFLMTRQTEPFCANQYKLILNSTSGLEGSTWGKMELTLFTETGKNETFTLTTESQEIKSGEAVKTLVAAHPSIVNVTRIQLSYAKYRGWIYNGRDIWHVDKISVLDSFGYTVSYCGPRTAIKDGETIVVAVQPGECHIEEKQPHRLARLVWQVVGDPVVGPQPRPPKLLWRIQVNDDPEQVEDAQSRRDLDTSYRWHRLS